MFYQVTAQVAKTIVGGTVSYQVPTFYLNSGVQGIVDAKHAETVALDVVNPTKDPSLTVSCYVTTVFPDQIDDRKPDCRACAGTGYLSSPLRPCNYCS